MKVLMVSAEIPSPLAGGIGTSISNIYQYLNKRVDVKLLISSRYAKSAETIPTGCPIIVPSLGRSVMEIVSFGRNSARYINKHYNKFDVVHLHLPLALGVLKYLSNDVLRKTLVTFHTTYAGYKNMFKLVKWTEIRTLDDTIGKLCYYNIMSKLEKKLSKKIKYVSAVSTGIADEIETFYGIDGIKIIPNGIKISGDRRKRGNIGIDPSTNHILFVGRLVMQKGIIDLIKTIDILKNNKYQFRLNICGRGYFERFIRDYINKNKLNRYVKILGYVPRRQLIRLYKISQIAIMPSLYEGLPMVGLELASSGLPIVATETARIQDIVCGSNISLIVPPRDHKKLSEKIEYLLKDLKNSANIGEKNMKKCTNKCNINKIADIYLKLYNEIAC